MLRSNSLYLTIPQPCQQAWGEMTPVDTGRFCSSCNKTVIDFTILSDQEVLAIMDQASSKVCGRFRMSQLNRSLYLQKRHQNIALPAVMISTALVAGTASDIAAQPKKPMTEMLRANELINTNLSTIPPAEKRDTLPVIAGIVLDTTSLPLAGIGVRIIATSYVTVTNEGGNFRFDIPDSLASEGLILEFSNIGMITQRIKLSDVRDMQAIDVRMQADSNILTGEVVVAGGVRVCRPTIWQRIKRLFR